MADQTARGEEFEKKAEKKLSGWSFLGNKTDEAVDFYEKAANCFKLAKNWERAGAVYIKLANCHIKLDSTHDAASAYVNAANCYKKYSNTDAANALNQAVNLFLDIGRLNMAARYCKELGELYEQEQNIEKAMDYLERAADLFQSEEVTTSANQCRQKVAEFAAQLEQYPKAIEILEAIARQSMNNNLLKYSVKGILLNAGICQLCRGDVVGITNALERYQELDPTFSGSREYKLLSNLAEALDEEDVAKFTDCIKEYDSMTRLMVGISVVGRDHYGVFPLKGKLLNVREASHTQMMNNAKMQNIKKILGLQHGKVYDSVKGLRYGHLLIMTDQDHDGSHIKGLLINFIHNFWPSLLKVPGFMVEFITPIVKVLIIWRT